MAKRGTGGSGLNMTARLDTAQAIKNAQDYIKVLNEIKAAAGISPNTAPTENFTQANIKMTKAIQDSILKSEKLRQENLDLQNQWQKGAITLQQLLIRQKELAMARQAEARAAKEARKAQEEVNGSYFQAQARLKALGIEIKAAENGFKKLTPELKAKVKEYNELNKALTKFDEKMGNHQRKVGSYKEAIRSTSEDLLSFATRWLSAGAALTYVFDQTLAFQNIKTPLTYILGSEGEANNKLAELKKLAKDLGLEYFTLANSYRSFTAASRASNFDLTQSEKIFKSVARSAAVLHLSSDQLEGSFLAIQQMISKGNVQAEELRGQLSERLPGAFALAAKAMGVTEKELNKLLQNGQVLASELLPKLADQLDKEYGNKAADGVQGLNAELGKLKSALQSLAGEGAFLDRNLFQPIIRGARLVLEELNQMTRGTAWENLSYLLTFRASSQQKQREVYDLRDLNANNKSALKAAKEYDIEGKSVGDLRTKYSQLNESLANANKAYDTFRKKVASGDAKETKDATLESFKKTAIGIAKEIDRVGAQLNKARKEQALSVKEIADGELTSVTAIRKRISELQKIPGSAIDGSDIFNRIEALKERLKKSTKSSNDSEINARNSLQKRIDELTDKSTRKQMSADDAEVESVRAKYKAMRDEAEKFNNNAKNKKAGLRVDGGSLQKAETSEVQFTIDKQSNSRLKSQLDEQAKMFEDNEKYKIEYGSKAAEERFTKEYNISAEAYRKQYATAEGYLQKLEEAQKSILDKFGDPSGYTEVQKQQLDIINDQIQAFVDKRKSTDAAYYAEAYRSALTHSQELAGIEADYQRKRLALGKDATAEQLTNLAREKDERIRSANEANAFAKSGYADLMMQYDELTRGEIRRRLEAMKESYRQQYREGSLTAEQLAGFIKQINSDIDSLNGNNSFNKIRESVKRYREQVKLLGEDSAGAKESQEEMFTAIADGAADVSSVISELASSFEQLGIGGEGLQDTLKNITGVVDGIGGIAKGLATGNPVDIVTGSIKLLTSAIELFNFKDKKLEKQIKGYQAQLDSLGKAYKQLERDVQNAVGESIYTDQAAQIENLKKQQEELIKMRDAENTKKKTDANKVKEYTDQIDAIPGQIDEINKAISQNLIQGTFRDLSNSLADALSEAFKAGEDGIYKMDEVFNNFIANAIKNSLKLKILDPVVKKFTDELTDYAKTNNNSIVGFDFDKWKEELKKAGDLFNAGLKGSEDFFKDINSGSTTTSDPKTGISGKIVGEALKEDTANRMLGLQQGQYDLTKGIGLTMGEMLQVGKAKLAALERIAINTLRGADNTDGIGGKLDKIVENTAPKTAPTDPLGQSLRDAGITG